MKDFRDVLEHSAVYTAGRQGRKRQLIQSEQVGYGVQALGGRLKGITVFGKTYDVLPIIEAALGLMSALDSFLEERNSN